MTTLTVSQVNFFLKSLIEGDGRLQNVAVTGEISNFTDHYRSGHLYFSLKDEKSVLKAVMFAPAARRLQFRPQDGMKVTVHGRVSVYEAGGQYQLYAERIEPQGVGALTLAYEQLKERLADEGLFDPARKRPLPPYPQRIGVITSPTGAAVQDILSITARRWASAEIIFAPVSVQGELAAPQLTQAVLEMNRKNACDVIIIGRGGGSMEDLWAFNDEALARAVAGSHIPVVSAVGHETDFTICDFAADVRAATPSAAAELTTPDRDEELMRCVSFEQELTRQMTLRLAACRAELSRLTERSPLVDPTALLTPWKLRHAELFGRLMATAAETVNVKQQTLRLLTGQLDAMSPLKTLARGYAVVQKADGELVKSTARLAPGEKITVTLSDGTATANLLTVNPKKGERPNARKEEAEL